MNMRKAWIATMLLAGSVVGTTDAWGQVPPGAIPTMYGPVVAPRGTPGPSPYAPQMYPGAPVGYMGPGPMGPGAMGPGGMGPGPMGPPNLMSGPMPGPMSGPTGPMPGYGVAPASYGYGEQGYSEGYGGEGDCQSCGNGDCDGTCGRRPALARMLGLLLPYDDGGCCAPHWFDAHVEYVNFRRDDVSSLQNFMSETPLGPIVLSTNDLDFQNESGFRATVATQVGVGSNLEFSYLGQFNWSSSAFVTDPGNGLFSVFSDYGTFPIAGQGFTETDQAAFASIAYSSSFDNIELNFRQRWQGYGCRLQGSWLAGVRYFQLDEQFLFTTQAPINNAGMNYFVGTSNQLTGFQVGGDIWASLLPGLSIGTEGKVGIYGNLASQQTAIVATTLNPPLEERVEECDVAFVGEAGLMANWRINQQWTFRGGYQFLYVTGVALAPENFNSTPPFLVPAFANPPRTPFLDQTGDVFYHGFTAGVEYMW